MIISILLSYWLLLSYAEEIFRQAPVHEKKLTIQQLPSSSIFNHKSLSEQMLTDL